MRAGTRQDRFGAVIQFADNRHEAVAYNRQFSYQHWAGLRSLGTGALPLDQGSAQPQIGRPYHHRMGDAFDHGVNRALEDDSHGVPLQQVYLASGLLSH